MKIEFEHKWERHLVWWLAVGWFTAAALDVVAFTLNWFSKWLTQ